MKHNYGVKVHFWDLNYDARIGKTEHADLD